MVDFKFYLNRQGAPGIKGDKGDKGEKGNTPTFSTGLNTPTVYTMIIDCGDGNRFETGNLKYPMRDDSGSVLKYDRENSTVAIGKITSDDIEDGVIGNGTITITQGGVTKGTFTTNQSGDSTIDLDAGSLTPTNMVTTNTPQTITARKTFTDGLGFSDATNSYYFTQYGSGYPIMINGGGYTGKVQFTSNYISVFGGDNVRLLIDGIHGFASLYGGEGLLIKTREVDSVAKNYLQTYGSAIDDKIYRYVSSDPSTPGTLTNFLLESDMLDGTTIQYNSTSGKVEVIGGGSGSSIIKKTLTQASANISESSRTVTVTDSDVTTSTLVTLYPGDTTTETWLANNLSSNIITEGTGSFTFSISNTLPSTFSMYYTIQEVS